MTETETLAVLRDIVGDVLGDPGLVLAREHTAADFAGWDSVAQVSIILAVEEHFAIRLRSREIDRLRCVGDFLDLIEARSAPAS